MANNPTALQCAFVRFLVDDPRRNGTRAAKRAGYKQPRTAAWELLNLPKYAHIQKLIKDSEKSFIETFERDMPVWYATFVEIRDFRKRSVFEKVIDKNGNEREQFKGFHNLSAAADRCLEEHTEKIYEGGRSTRIKAKSSSAAAKMALEYYKTAKQFAGPPVEDEERVNEFLELMMGREDEDEPEPPEESDSET